MTGSNGTTTSDTSAPARNVPLLVVAAGLVIAVVVAVLFFGVSRPPELASLADEPEPGLSASIVWRTDDGSDEPCLAVATPEGSSSEELFCDRDLGELVAWDDRGIVVRAWGMQEELRWLDPATGDEVDREQISDDGAVPATHGRSDITSRERSGMVRVTLEETGQVIWETQANDHYRVQTGSLSPDGQWVVMVDSAERLLLVPADGSAEPRIWSEDVPSWEAPVWEGTTVDIDRG